MVFLDSCDQVPDERVTTTMRLPQVVTEISPMKEESYKVSGDSQAYEQQSYQQLQYASMIDVNDRVFPRDRWIFESSRDGGEYCVPLRSEVWA